MPSPLWESVEIVKEYQWLLDFNFISFLTRQDVSIFEEIDLEMLKKKISEVTSILPRRIRPSHKPCKYNIRLDGASPKKKHEIMNLICLCDELTTSYEPRADWQAIDMGAGQCYLSRALLSIPKFKEVYAIEGEAAMKDGMQRKEKQLPKSVRDSLSKLNFINLHVDEKTTLEKVLSEIPDDWGTRREECTARIMVSLHSCGDLTTNMLRMLAQRGPWYNRLELMVCVGCCYNMMKSDEPLSEALRKIYDATGFSMTYDYRQVACQSPVHDDKSSNPGLFYRALLEVLNSDNGGGVISPNVSKCEDEDWMKYVEKHGPEKKQTAPSVFMRYIKYRALFYNLWNARCMLGRVLEQIILLDRVEYLRENTTSYRIDLYTIFDPEISPRNVAIVAYKSTHYFAEMYWD